MRQAAGFTLIEILIVVALVSVFAAMAAPMIGGAMTQYNINSAGQQVVSTIRTARFQAVARNSDVRVAFDTAASTYQAEIWDEDTMAWVALGDVQTLPTDITFGTAEVIAMEPTGRAPTCAPCTIVVTNGTADDDRTILVSTSGRVQLQQ